MKYYVYELINSLDEKVFYVGKGREDEYSFMKTEQRETTLNPMRIDIFVTKFNSSGKIME